MNGSPPYSNQTTEFLGLVFGKYAYFSMLRQGVFMRVPDYSELDSFWKMIDSSQEAFTRAGQKALKDKLAMAVSTLLNTDDLRSYNASNADILIKTNPYTLFGVSQDATVKDISLAMRQKRLALHPDKGGDTKAWQEVYPLLRSAQNILADINSRNEIDRLLQEATVIYSAEVATSEASSETTPAPAESNEAAAPVKSNEEGSLQSQEAAPVKSSEDSSSQPKKKKNKNKKKKKKKKKSQIEPAESNMESLPSKLSDESSQPKTKAPHSSQPKKKTKVATNQSTLDSFYSSKPSADSLPKSKATSKATSHQSKRKATMTESRNSSNSTTRKRKAKSKNTLDSDSDDDDDDDDSDSDFEDDNVMIQSKKTKGGTRSARGAQAKTNSSTKPPAKRVTPDVMTSCVVAVSAHLGKVSHFKAVKIDGTTVRVKPEYIISIPSEDGLSCEYSLDEEKLLNAGVTFPDHSLISTIEPICPNEKYLWENFPIGNNVTQESDRLVQHLKTVVLKPLVGPNTEFKKKDDQIRQFLKGVIMPRVRKRKKLFSMSNIAVENLAEPDRGLNSMVQDFDNVVRPSLLGLIQDGVVPESKRPSSLEAHSFMIGAVSQVSCFDEEDAQLIANSSVEDYVSLCVNSVPTDSLDPSNALAIQDAQNNRGESGLNLWVYVKGATIAARQGAAVPVTYTDDTKGLLVALPVVGETFQKPECIGGLKKKFLRRTWGKKDFEDDGACVRITFRTQYFYDLCTCRVGIVYTKEELDKMTSSPHNYIRNTIVPLNDEYFIAFLQESTAFTGDDGLTAFQYRLNVEPRVEGGDLIQRFVAHQLTEMVKRQIGADSRGPVMDWAVARLGFPNQTPEQIFAIVGQGNGRDKEAVLPFIQPEEENEIGDIEHSLGRDELTDNRGEITRGLNHSRNVRIVTTQSQKKTEKNGTGDHNFCHVHVAWKANSHRNRSS